jgi:hypothetical protein
MKTYTIFKLSQTKDELRPLQPRDWDKYRQMVAVALWRAVALSCDLDPVQLRKPIKTRLAKAPGGNAETVLRKIFTVSIPEASFEQFKEWYAIASNCLKHNQGLTVVSNSQYPQLRTIRLPQFAHFAIERKWPIPLDLSEIAAAAPIEIADLKATKKWELPDRIEYIARQIAVAWVKQQNKMPSVEQIAKHVEQELKRKDIKGARGDYLDWQTIKREALTGITGRKSKGKK